MSVRKVVSVAAVAAMAVVGSVFVGGDAEAYGGLTGRCPSGAGGQFCLYYNSYEQGAMREWFDSDPDFAGETFWGTGLAGNGYPVKNDAASAENAWTVNGEPAVVHYNSNYQGAYDIVYQGESRQLGLTYNENASFNWYTAY